MMQSQGQWSAQVQGARLAMDNAGLAKITGLEVEGALLISVSKRDPERQLIP
jgi:hypothetical protein